MNLESRIFRTLLTCLTVLPLAIATTIAAPQSQLWAGYPVSENGYAQTDDFLGALDVNHSPWIFGKLSSKMFFLPEENVQDEGAWLYLPRQGEEAEILSAQVSTVNLDFALIHTSLSVPAIVRVHWGTSSESLDNTSDWSTGAPVNEHMLSITDLPLNQEVFFKVEAKIPQGLSSLGEIISFQTGEVVEASQVSRHGITWTFDKAHPVGQFPNGDWWVVGPVEIVQIDPAPGPIPIEEDIADVIDHNQYQTTSLRADRRWKNGSMIVKMSNGLYQAYDSRNANYNESLRFLVGETLNPGQSLVSSISHNPETGYPAQVLYHELMWQSEKQGSRVLKTAAVLTSLDEVPSGDTLRPAYVDPATGQEKETFRLRDIQWNLLHRLPMPELTFLSPTDHPDWEAFERYFERVWLDHIGGHWYDQRFAPSENQAYYGRDYARLVGKASLMLHLDVPKSQKLTLLTRLLQLGIDLRGMALQGSTWSEGGGLTSGRKWPILFASMMLIEDYTYDLPETAVFHEDVQTYWGEGWNGQRALYQMVYHTAPRLTYMERTPDQWTNWDTSGAFGRSWAIRSEEYRSNTTVRAWPAQTLAALLMNAKGLWNHDAYFEVVDDWMRTEDLYAENRLNFPRPHPSRNPYPTVPGLSEHIVSLWSYAFETTSYEPFVTQMWRLYRDSDAFPHQPHGDTHRMWDPFHTGEHRGDNRWVPNDRIRWVPNTMPTHIGPDMQ